MAVGKVKWFNDARGFGFIERADGSELFVHFSGIHTSGHSMSSGTGAVAGRRTLKQGQEVEFDIYEGEKGPLAKNVTPRE